MAKRELIDREKAENTTWEEPSYTDALNVLTEVRDKIRELPIITEQEIVKSVLEKLKAEIGKSKTEHEMQIAERDIKAKLLISNIYSDIVNILDKCKAESEG